MFPEESYFCCLILAPLKVYSSVDEFPGLPNAVVTIGTFDGVHAGHCKIIQRLNEVAKETGGETLLLTFFPHPRMVLQPDDSDLKLITTMEERKLLLKKNGIDHLIIQPFSKEFSRISATEFVRDVLLGKMGMKTLVIGYDHHFGRNREGSYKELEEMATMYGFRLEEISKQVIDEVDVSSTKIRKALLVGDVEAANKLLGHDFTLQGEVVKGDRIGTLLGFPTANIKIQESYKLIPDDGIYAAMVEADQVLYKGMLYLGTRPTVDGKKHTSEVNILDFDQDIYGKTITVFLKTRIRGDMHFDNLEQLKEKMKEDLKNATKLLS